MLDLNAALDWLAQPEKITTLSTVLPVAVGTNLAHAFFDQIREFGKRGVESCIQQEMDLWRAQKIDSSNNHDVMREINAAEDMVKSKIPGHYTDATKQSRKFVIATVIAAAFSSIIIAILTVAPDIEIDTWLILVIICVVMLPLPISLYCSRRFWKKIVTKTRDSLDHYREYQAALEAAELRSVKAIEKAAK